MPYINICRTLGSMSRIAIHAYHEVADPEPSHRDDVDGILRGNPRKGRTVKGTVLVIDDEQLIQDLLGPFLAEQGYEVTSALDADAGRVALREGPFDIVLADLHIPGGRGDELCLEAKGLSPETRSIIMTGDSTSHGDEILAHSGADGVLYKPFSLRELLAVLDRMQADRVGGA